MKRQQTKLLLITLTVQCRAEFNMSNGGHIVSTSSGSLRITVKKQKLMFWFLFFRKFMINWNKHQCIRSSRVKLSIIIYSNYQKYHKLNMIVNATRCCCLVITVLARIFYTHMLAWIFNSFMFGFVCSATCMCCLVITMLTWIFNSFMFWPYMLLKTTCCFCLEITVLTRIFNSFMFWPYMLLKTTHYLLM